MVADGMGKFGNRFVVNVGVLDWCWVLSDKLIHWGRSSDDARIFLVRGGPHTAYLFMVVEFLRVMAEGKEKEPLAGASGERLDS
jgi:hypothetical protein